MLATLWRTAVFYLIVILSIRLMGKRQVGELQPGELVVTILISELASIPMQDLSSPVANGIIAILVLIIMEIILSVLSLKSGFIRRLFSGKPAIIIADGVVDQQMMKRLRISIDDLLEGLRQAGSFNLSDISYAVMETNGKLSVLEKKSASCATKSDLFIKAEESGMQTVVISDGNYQNPPEVDKAEVEKYLKEHNLMLKQVFLLTVDSTGNFYHIKKDGAL
jgi:uncharacterized membrane protein YcaP (DUF421 family)